MNGTYPVGPIVYYAQISDSKQYVKIGRTVNLDNRIKGFLRDLKKFNLPETVEILDWVECKSELESAKFESFLHVRCGYDRVINRPYPNSAEYFTFDAVERTDLETSYGDFQEVATIIGCPFEVMRAWGHVDALQREIRKAQEYIETSNQVFGERPNGG